MMKYKHKKQKNLIVIQTNIMNFRKEISMITLI